MPFQKKQPAASLLRRGSADHAGSSGVYTLSVCCGCVCLLLSSRPAEDLPPILDQLNQQLPQPMRKWISGRQQFCFVIRQIL